MSASFKYRAAGFLTEARPRVRDAIEEPLRAKRRELVAKGRKLIDWGTVVPLCHGQFMPDQEVMDLFVEVAQGKHGNPYEYASGNAYQPGEVTPKEVLLESISQWYQKSYGVEAPTENIFLTSGGGECMGLVMRTFIDPGDGLVAFDPSYQNLRYFPDYYRCEWRTASLIEEEGWSIDPDSLRKAITEKTKAITLVNPENPTAIWHGEKELRQLLDIAGEHEVPIISDELYNQFTYDSVEAHTIAQVSKDVPCFVNQSLTKNWLLPGFRVGFTLIHDPENKLEDYRKMLTKYVRWPSIHVSTPAAITTSLILRRENKSLKNALVELQKRRDYAWRRMSETESISMVKQTGAYYGFPKVDAIGKVWKDDTQFCVDLLEETGISVIPGPSFGTTKGPQHFRISILPPIEILKEIWDRFGAFLAKKTK